VIKAVTGLMATALEPLALAGGGLLLLCWLLWRRGVRGLPLWLALGLTVSHFWFAAPLGANLLVRAVEGDPDSPRICRPGAGQKIVVALAGGMRGVRGDEPPIGGLKEATFRRTAAAAALAAGDPESLLVVSGGLGGPDTEADLMRSLAVSLGVPEERIVLERGSLTTYESALRVAEWADERGIGRVHLVTSALHMPRAAATFERQGLTVCPHPVDWKQVPVDPGSWFFPQISALARSTAAIREAMALVWYRISGRLT